MTQTLSDLKKAIADSAKLGSVPAADQRVFYMGRELKTLNRSLSKVLGRQHGVNVIHFMAIQRSLQQQQQLEPEGKAAQGEAAESDDDDDIVVVEDNRQNKPAVMIDLADDEDDSDVEEILAPQPSPKRRRRV